MKSRQWHRRTEGTERVEQTEDKLIREEQNQLDGIIQQMDIALRKLEINRKQNLRKADSAKANSLPDTYGALISANHEVKRAGSMISLLRKGKDELYTHRLVVDCTERGTKDELNVPLGLHTYSYLDHIFIYSWTNPIWRHFVLDHTATEYNSVVKGKYGEEYTAHYRLKLKREVEILFDTIKSVQQFYPLDTEDSEGFVYDAFLKELLKRRSEREFRNIVFSIQKKQGEIIGSPFKRNIILQGCAGSGKSMIMMHRLPIILYDNGQILSRSNVYIISPSVTYIEMSDHMRAELEIEDLNIGTMNQYYDHLIQKYGRDPKKQGVSGSGRELKRDIVEYVYSERLTESIKNSIQDLLALNAVDYQDAFMTLEMPVKTPDGKETVQRIRQEIVIAQSILGKNSDSCRKYSEAIRNVLLSLDRLQSFLSARRPTVLNTIDSRIVLLKESISKDESELKEAGYTILPATANRLRKQMRNARDRIIYFQKEKEQAVKDVDYFSKLESAAGQISDLTSLFPANHGGRPSQSGPSEEMQYRQIMHVQRLIDLCRFICTQIEKLEDTYVEYAPSIHQNLSELRKSVSTLERVDDPVLSPVYVNHIRERVVYLQKLSTSIADDVYGSILEGLGQKKNRREKYDALACSPFIYLQILYLLEGPPNSAAESLLAIDEAQNLALEELRLLDAVNKGQTVFNLYGDVRQHVEGSKGVDSWEDFSPVAFFHTYTIEENYRNARQITEYCNKCFGMNMRAINLDGSGVHIMPEDTGLDRELGDILKRPLKPGISCIIVKSAGEAAEIMRQQKKIGTVVHDLTAAPSALYPNHWNMMTVGQAKGLEFETVIVFSAGMSENEKYIAYTRALDELYIYDEDLLKGVKKGILVNDKVKDVFKKQETRLAAETRPKRKQRTKTSVSGEKQDALSVKEFFEKRGIEVIDDRNQSGFLWVIGTEDRIGTAVNEAVSRYGIYGMYGRGKVSKNKPGWFTKTKK